MEACVRLFNGSTALNRRLFFTKTTTTTSSTTASITNRFLKSPLNNNNVLCRPTSFHSRIHSSISPINTSNPVKLFLSLSHSRLLNISCSTPFRPAPNDAGFTWNPAPRGVVDGGASVAGFGVQGKAVTVVLLGWMGAKTKHLRRYVEWYNSKGINAITFVVDVREVLWFDLGRRADKRVSDLRDTIATWVSEKEEDGRERCLIFHTFSNTGWFVCGTILDGFQGRQDLMDKIKGFVVDSGGVELLNPKVWAGGFCAAILKQYSSSTFTPVVSVNGFEGGEVSAIKTKKKEPQMMEIMVLRVLEKIFTSIVNSPEMNQRLTNVLSIRTSDQLSCPWLHLYSRGDTVVPYKSIESLVEEQRNLGKKVFNYDFRLTPHVDHFRNFREKYTSELQKFLKECFATAKPT
ncbi:hypothetical protein ACOSP7_022840 [Xanthoceras sorbifolium]